jgi:hypothetical protein
MPEGIPKAQRRSCKDVVGSFLEKLLVSISQKEAAAQGKSDGIDSSNSHR